MTPHGWAHRGREILFLGHATPTPVYTCPRCGVDSVFRYDHEHRYENRTKQVDPKTRVRTRTTAEGRTSDLPIPDDCDEELARQVLSS